ncbi:proline-rich protein 15 [Erpetoichthys calabaricus]|uniref:proline-rich protein 15 n=1 Tax=Erpetoichthys calabaricus TaxID=27687 RepID=UPI00109F97F1|nr:proline-rich protein 15 [Erpetoichthys calabaricus]
MADKGSWWKSVTRKKAKDVSSHVEVNTEQQQVQQQSVPSKAPTSDCQENQHPNMITDIEFNDPKIESTFNGTTSRRNLKISQSGRFKVKRKVRVPLPESTNFYEDKNATLNDELH